MGTAFPILRASSIRPLHIQSFLESPSTQSLFVQSQSDDVHLPFVDDSRDSQLLKRDVNSFKRNQEPSGLGLVGQQTKDLQERVSSIAMASDGAPGRENASKKVSRSAPAMFARHERRMPRRRFQGDRTRPEMKRSSSSNAAKTFGERKQQRAETTKDSGGKRPLRVEAVKYAGEKEPHQAQVMKKMREKKPRWVKATNGLSENENSSAKTTSKSEEPNEKDEQPKPQTESWGIQKKALKEKFGEQGWKPRKRLSPDALDGIRTLHAQYPETYSTPVLAEHFKVSPEAIRRILKSKWQPNEEEEEKRKRRWEKRGENIWTEMSKLGVKPPKPWRQKGIGRLSEREGRGHRRSFAALEEEIGTGSAQGVITTRVRETHEVHRSLAHKIF